HRFSWKKIYDLEKSFSSTENSFFFNNFMCFLIEFDTAQRDIVFLLDGSDYTRDGFQTICQFVGRVVDKLSVGQSAEQVSVVQYSTHTQVHFLLNTHSSMQDVLRAIESLQHQGGSPLNTGAALEYVKKHVFTVSSGSRQLEGVPQILILVTGGRSQDDVRDPKMGVIPISIGTTNADTLELQTVSHQPNYFFITNFENLLTIKENVLALIKGASATPTPTTFLPGFGKSWYSLFLILHVTSIREHNLLGYALVALVQYNRNATANFYLNTYSNNNEVLNSVRSLKHKGGRPLNTGAALQFVRDYIFSPSFGGRHLEGVAQILYMFCGGRSNDDIRGVSQTLRKSDVKVFTIGTKNADTLELQTMSSTPIKSNWRRFLHKQIMHMLILIYIICRVFNKAY
uniref:VWFA domain-containing protein n=1 Tax=Electrophorus electricus TaxID=8005 RepID=A0AAY5E9L9_ELEEL